MQVRNLSIEEWVSLAKKNIFVPIKTTLHGESMEPFIRNDKDVVTILPIQSLNRELKIGDIVLFKRADELYVVHRVYKIFKDEHRLQTWGDNCRNPDASIPEARVLGIVISFERGKKIIHLESKKYQSYGIKWLNQPFRRKLWFGYQRMKAKFL